MHHRITGLAQPFTVGVLTAWCLAVAVALPTTAASAEAPASHAEALTASDSTGRWYLTAEAGAPLTVPPGGVLRLTVPDVASAGGGHAVAHLWLKLPDTGELSASALADGHSYMELSARGTPAGPVVDAVGLVSGLDQAAPVNNVVYFANYLMFASLEDGLAELTFESVGPGFEVLPKSFFEFTPSDHRELSLSAPDSVTSSPGSTGHFLVSLQRRGNLPAPETLSLNAQFTGSVKDVRVRQVSPPDSAAAQQWQVSYETTDQNGGALIVKAVGAYNNPSAAVAIQSTKSAAPGGAAVAAGLLAVPPVLAAGLYLRRRWLLRTADKAPQRPRPERV